MAQLELDEFMSVCLEKGSKAWPGVCKVGREDGEVGERGHGPGCEDEQSVVVQGHAEGAQGREVNGVHVRGGITVSAGGRGDDGERVAVTV